MITTAAATHNSRSISPANASITTQGSVPQHHASTTTTGASGEHFPLNTHTEKYAYAAAEGAGDADSAHDNHQIPPQHELRRQNAVSEQQQHQQHQGSAPSNPSYATAPAAFSSPTAAAGAMTVVSAHPDDEWLERQEMPSRTCATHSGRYWGIFMTLCVVGFPVGVYYGCYVRQNCTRTFASYEDVRMVGAVISAVIFSFFFGLMMWSFARVVSVHPGRVPAFMHRAAVEEVARRAAVLFFRQRVDAALLIAAANNNNSNSTPSRGDTPRQPASAENGGPHDAASRQSPPHHPGLVIHTPRSVPPVTNNRISVPDPLHATPTSGHVTPLLHHMTLAQERSIHWRNAGHDIYAVPIHAVRVLAGTGAGPLNNTAILSSSQSDASVSPSFTSEATNMTAASTTSDVFLGSSTSSGAAVNRALAQALLDPSGSPRSLFRPPIGDGLTLIRMPSCHKCAGGVVKALDTHHCSSCGQCITYMDHHCPWIGQCVGRDNHKFFLQFLLYTTFSALIAAISIARDLFDGPASFVVAIGIRGGPSATDACSWLLFFAFLFAIAFALMLGPFFGSSFSTAAAGDTKLGRMIRTRQAEEARAAEHLNRLLEPTARTGGDEARGSVRPSSPNNNNPQDAMGWRTHLSQIAGPLPLQRCGLLSWALPMLPVFDARGDFVNFRNYISHAVCAALEQVYGPSPLNQQQAAPQQVVRTLHTRPKPVLR